MKYTKDGFELFVITGIDGRVEEFETYYEKKLFVKPTEKLLFDRKLSFFENISQMRSIINSYTGLKRKVLLGWSIGGAAAAFLSNCTGVVTCIMINSFYDRTEILTKRGIHCDEGVCLKDAYNQANLYVIIRGELDDKISPEQSDKIFNLYQPETREIYTFPCAGHKISSFPLDEVVDIINNKLR